MTPSVVVANGVNVINDLWHAFTIIDVFSPYILGYMTGSSMKVNKPHVNGFKILSELLPLFFCAMFVAIVEVTKWSIVASDSDSIQATIASLKRPARYNFTLLYKRVKSYVFFFQPQAPFCLLRHSISSGPIEQELGRSSIRLSHNIVHLPVVETKKRSMRRSICGCPWSHFIILSYFTHSKGMTCGENTPKFSTLGVFRLTSGTWTWKMWGEIFTPKLWVWVERICQQEFLSPLPPLVKNGSSLRMS